MLLLFCLTSAIVPQAEHKNSTPCSKYFCMEVLRFMSVCYADKRNGFQICNHNRVIRYWYIAELIFTPILFPLCFWNAINTPGYQININRIVKVAFYLKIGKKRLKALHRFVSIIPNRE